MECDGFWFGSSFRERGREREKERIEFNEGPGLSSDILAGNHFILTGNFTGLPDGLLGPRCRRSCPVI